MIIRNKITITSEKRQYSVIHRQKPGSPYPTYEVFCEEWMKGKNRINQKVHIGNSITMPDASNCDAMFERSMTTASEVYDRAEQKTRSYGYTIAKVGKHRGK